MKFLKIFQAALLATAVTFSFTACDDDDDPEPGTENNDGGSTGTTTPPVADAGILFPVTSISDGSTFTYVDGRMVGGVTSYDVPFTITSNPLSIKEEAYYENGEFERTIYSNIRVNSAGYVTYANVKYEDAEYNEEYGLEAWSASGSVTITYDGEGHLTNAKSSLADNEGNENDEISITWKDGDMMNVVERYAWSDDEEGNGGETHSASFTYGQNRPNSGVFMKEVEFCENYLWYAGLLGKPSKNIPTSIVEQNKYDENSEGYTTTYAIDVEYNDNGSVSSLVYNYVYDGGSFESHRYIYGYGATKAAAVSVPGTKKPVFGPAKRMIERMKSRRNNK